MTTPLMEAPRDTCLAPVKRNDLIAGLTYIACCLASETTESDELFDLLRKKKIMKDIAEAYQDKKLKDKYFPNF
jgi:hypothetical protein